MFVCGSSIVCVGQIGSHFILHLHNNIFCVYANSLVNMQVTVVNMHVSVVNMQVSVVNMRVSVVNMHVSVVNMQVSVVNMQVSVVNVHASVMNMEVSVYIICTIWKHINSVCSILCVKSCFVDVAILILSYHNKCWVVVVCSRTANLHNDLCMTVSIVSVCM